jgi:hypothetical protein
MGLALGGNCNDVCYVGENRPKLRLFKSEMLEGRSAISRICGHDTAPVGEEGCDNPWTYHRRVGRTLSMAYVLTDDRRFL